MEVTARIIEGPVGAGGSAPVAPGAGASLTFEGVVRPLENNAPIEALEYEAYMPMAQTQLERLGAEVAERHGLLALHVLHSTGRVPVGGCSFRLTVAAPHRAEALSAIAEFIDALKRDVPIWKTAVPMSEVRR